MGRKQLVAVYAVVVFMMVWGFELLNAIKFKHTVVWADVVSPFNFTQFIYVTVTFALAYYLFQQFYLRRRFVLLAAGFVGLLLLFILLRYVLEEMLCPLLLGSRNYREDTTLVYYTLDNLYYGIIYIILGVLIFLLNNQIATQKAQAQLLQHSREAELQALRSQVNPHFLFNTLNNIYALVYEGSSKAPDAVLRLADLMRYMLYERKEKVPVTQEWTQLLSLIELQRLRFDHPLPIEAKLEGEAENCSIAPHLLLPFVENAFKHSDLTDPASPLLIQLRCTKNGLTFFTQNKIGSQQKDATGGVGLENVRRRLALLYPSRHELDIRRQADVFTVALSLTF